MCLCGLFHLSNWPQKLLIWFRSLFFMCFFLFSQYYKCTWNVFWWYKIACIFLMWTIVVSFWPIKSCRHKYTHVIRTKTNQQIIIIIDVTNTVEPTCNCRCIRLAIQPTTYPYFCYDMFNWSVQWKILKTDMTTI